MAGQGKLPNKVFHSIAEFEDAAENASKSAMKSTLNYFKRMLQNMAIDAIYKNAYSRKWYDRTNWLKDENAIETYMFKNMKNTWGGGVRFNREVYDEFSEPFQHGNPVHYLPMGSYLEIMNDSSLLPSGKKNVFNFPTRTEIDRGHFYDDFLEKLDSEKYGFKAVFGAFFEAALKSKQTGKPTIPNIPKENKTFVSRSGATSSSTQQYSSLHSSNIE